MLEMNTTFSGDRRMTWTQEIGLRDVLIPLECVIHLNSELKIFQSSQTTSLVPLEKTNLTGTFSLLTIRGLKCDGDQEYSI